MESLLVEQSLSPRKQIKTPKRKTHQTQHLNHPHVHQLHQISRHGSLILSKNNNNHEFDMMMMMHGGFFLNNHPTPPYHHHVSNSLPPPQMSLGQQHQPPLLPLPVVPRPAFRSLPSPQPLSRRHSLSPPTIPRKTPIKTKTLPKLKKFNKIYDENNNDNSPVQFSSDKFAGKAKGIKDGNNTSGVEAVIGPIKKVGPDPERVEMDKFSGSIFSLAPPPSSLPLPKFSLRQLPRRPQLSCTAEAAAAVAEVVDTGATDNICKLLRLR